MGFDSIKGSIENFFSLEWEEKTLIEFENVLIQKAIDKSWIRLTVLTGGSFQNGFHGGGVNQYRTVGEIVLSIFIPVGGGTSEGDKLADKAVSILRGAHFDNIVCKTPSLNNIGITGEWYQINLNTPFTIDEIN